MSKFGSGTRSVRQGTILVLLCAVQFIDAFDIASMGPALPKIQHDLGMPPDSLQWVVTAYVLGYGGFLLLGGRLADLFDRKRLLVGAMVVFTIASLVGGFATSGEMLIVARLVKGIAAAFTAPASLAILLSIYEDPDARNKALGSYLSIAAIGFTSGLVFGGLLADINWRLVLFVPAGLGLIVSIAAGSVVPSIDHHGGRERQPVDILGAVTVTTGLLALVYGVSEASTRGWGDARTVAALVVAFVLIMGFIQIERVRKAPLVPLRIFRTPGLSQANIVVFLFQGSYVGWQFLVTLYLQNVMHWSPIEVGLIFAPGGLMVVLTAQRWAGLVGKIGAWPIALVGILLICVGFLWTLEIGNLNSVVVFGVAQVIMGTGYAMCYPATNITAVAGAQPDEQGLASGLFIAAFQIGSGVLLGIVASVFAGADGGLSAYRAGIIVAIGATTLAALICAFGVVRNLRPAERRRPADSAASIVREPADDCSST